MVVLFLMWSSIQSVSCRIKVYFFFVCDLVSTVTLHSFQHSWRFFTGLYQCTNRSFVSWSRSLHFSLLNIKGSLITDPSILARPHWNKGLPFTIFSFLRFESSRNKLKNHTLSAFGSWWRYWTVLAQVLMSVMLHLLPAAKQTLSHWSGLCPHVLTVVNSSNSLSMKLW